ncbi:hypothetical protein ACFFWC_23295 [Plantactinospora siamensis]|uniref:ANTAR domain-containing protein n=1 Tax=Plantactinospora siamensis TaxID=555372 RepID=A0ABV6NUN4_9ACTN
MGPSARWQVNREALATQMADRLQAGIDISQILWELRHQGISLMDAVVIMRSVTGASLGEAKRMVHTSEAFGEIARKNDSNFELDNGA